MTTQLCVTPRRPGDPQVDPMPLLLLHRAMLTDVARFATLLSDLARAGEPIEARRARGIRDYLVVFGEELHQHHHREDAIAWPVIAASAGAAVDLTPLSEDHAVLAPLIATMVGRAGDLVTDPAVGALPLAVSLRELSELLHEHIPEEERDVLPVITRYVSVPDWEAAQRRMRAGTSLRHLAWALPWLERCASSDELARLLDEGGLTFRLLLALTRGRYRHRERLIFGTDRRPSLTSTRYG